MNGLMLKLRGCENSTIHETTDDYDRLVDTGSHPRESEPAHVILFAGGVLSYIFAYRSDKDKDEDEEQPAGAQHTQA